MAQFLKRQIGRVDFLLCSMFQRSAQTAAILAPVLGVSTIVDSAAFDPDGTAQKAWQEIKFIVGDAEEVLVVTHHPLTDDLLSKLCGVHVDETHMKHGTIAHVHGGSLAWMVNPALIARDEEDAVVEAALNTAEALLTREAKGEHYYEEEEQKRWVLGDGGLSGNCEACIENSEEGWIAVEDTWPNADDVPAHPHCSCSIENKTRRVRHSYFDDEDE
jgi:phosphohistidine phosphatase SixA